MSRRAARPAPSLPFVPSGLLPPALLPPRFLPSTLFLPALLPLAGCGPMPQAGEGIVTRWGDDLLGAGPVPTIAESVPGDVMLAGQDLYFTGTAGGDYLGAGARQRIEGTIDGSVRAAGADVEVSADVGRNATLAGARVLLAPDGRVEDNGYFAGALVRVDGAIGGHLRAAGDEIVIQGAVEGDVSVDGSILRVGPDARIAGELVHRVPEEGVEIDPGAQIAGGISAQPPREGLDLPGWMGWWMLRVLWGLGFLLAGLVIVAVLPGLFLGASGALSGRPMTSLGFGLLWLVGVPVVAGVFLVTVIGVPLALVLAALFFVLLYVGRAVPAVWIGRRLLSRGEPAAPGEPVEPADVRGPVDAAPEPTGRPGRGAAVGAFLLGGLILVLLGLIPLIGPLVGLLAAVIGAGALLARLREPLRAEAG